MEYYWKKKFGIVVELLEKYIYILVREYVMWRIWKECRKKYWK